MQVSDRRRLKRMGAETNFVRLPDSSFVGWQTTTETKP